MLEIVRKKSRKKEEGQREKKRIKLKNGGRSTP
jgi:hypothetical protein